MNTQTSYEVVANLINETGETVFYYAIRRLSDRRLFQLGDYVSDNFGRQGYIKAFDYDAQAKELSICIGDTDADKIPLEETNYWKPFYSEKVYGDHSVFLNTPCSILAVHSYNEKVKYDIELWLPEGKRSRVYNVGSDMVSLVKADGSGPKKPASALIHNNSHAFRQFLRESGIDYKPADQFTEIPIEVGVDLFRLGVKWNEYQAANMPTN